jgi:hypothetical protein
VSNDFTCRRGIGENVAAAALTVAADGDYHVLVRYEMPYRFEVAMGVKSF